jgi:hypothetical protein
MTTAVTWFETVNALVALCAPPELLELEPPEPLEVLPSASQPAVSAPAASTTAIAAADIMAPVSRGARASRAMRAIRPQYVPRCPPPGLAA